ncbi:MAG: hypothetical protein ACR2GO_02950, partial [Candidatus Limnocylindria bacterium]
MAIGLAAAVLTELRPAMASGTAPVRQSTGATPLGPTVHAAASLSLILLLAALVLRAIVTGHAPWSNMYEFNQGFAAAILAGYLGLARRLPVRALAPLVAVPAAALV